MSSSRYNMPVRSEIRRTATGSKIIETSPTYRGITKCVNHITCWRHWRGDVRVSYWEMGQDSYGVSAPA